jgi:hypothetical protein
MVQPWLIHAIAVLSAIRDLGPNLRSPLSLDSQRQPMAADCITLPGDYSPPWTSANSVVRSLRRAVAVGFSVHRLFAPGDSSISRVLSDIRVGQCGFCWTKGPICNSQGHRPWNSKPRAFDPQAPTGRSESSRTRSRKSAPLGLCGTVFERTRGCAPGCYRLGRWPTSIRLPAPDQCRNDRGLRGFAKIGATAKRMYPVEPTSAPSVVDSLRRAVVPLWFTWLGGFLSLALRVGEARPQPRFPHEMQRALARCQCHNPRAVSSVNSVANPLRYSFN